MDALPGLESSPSTTSCDMDASLTTADRAPGPGYLIDRSIPAGRPAKVLLGGPEVVVFAPARAEASLMGCDSHLRAGAHAKAHQPRT